MVLGVSPIFPTGTIYHLFIFKERVFGKVLTSNETGMKIET